VERHSHVREDVSYGHRYAAIGNYIIGTLRNRQPSDMEILETEETLSMGVSNYRDGVFMTERRKRQRLIIDSELMNLPDLNAYVKVPNNPFITLTRFAIKDYPARTTPFIIRDNLILETITERQPIIEPVTENTPRTAAVSNAL
jgi:type IV secretory pathway TraG/TraD family ATPase VirD4